MSRPDARDARIAQLETELAQYKEAVRVLGKSVDAVRSDADWPSLTNTMTAGLFCGAEDRNLRDRYDGARYGYEKALERCYEFIQNATSDALNNPIAAAAIKKEAGR